MYDILVVDDDLFTLALLEEKLKDYGDFFTPVYASNGKDAVEILSHEEISLLVTDLVMPGDINGWHLIEYIESFHPHIPVVVLTGCADEDKLQQLRAKVRKVLLKPVRVNQLVKVIISILNEAITDGTLKGFSVSSILQLLELDEKTCLLEVGTSPENKGLLYVNQGKLYDAEYGDLKETEAACRLIALDNVNLQIKTLPKIEIRRRIKTELMTIIMKAKSLKDETDKNNSGAGLWKAEPQQLIGKKHDVKRQQAEAVISLERAQIVRETDKEGQELDENTHRKHRIGRTKDVIFSARAQVVNGIKLETIFEGLRSIKGYKAAALMNFTGEIIMLDSIDSTVDLENIGPVFNDVLRTAEEAAGKTGLGVCDEFVLKTPEGVIVMSCSGTEATVYFHLITILDRDGNQALTKIQLTKMIPLIAQELGP